MVKIKRWLVLQREIIKSHLRTLLIPKNENGFLTIIEDGKDININGAFEALEESWFRLVKKQPELLD